MVKRKAKIELDEWLRLVPSLSRMENANPPTLEKEVVSDPIPTAETSLPKVGDKLTPTLPANGTVEDNE